MLKFGLLFSAATLGVQAKPHEKAELIARVDNFQRQLLRARRAVEKAGAGATRNLLFGAAAQGDDTCEVKLAKLEAKAAAPSLLFVQMANNCTLTHKDGVFTLFTEDMAKDTWSFSDRPFQLEDTIPTAGFVDNFATMFSNETGGAPNAAFTFVHEDHDQFAGPLIAVMIQGFSHDDAHYSYTLGQSGDQADDGSLDSFFHDGDTVTFTDCSLFIDSVKACPPFDPDAVCVIEQDKLNNLGYDCNDKEKGNTCEEACNTGLCHFGCTPGAGSCCAKLAACCCNPEKRSTRFYNYGGM